MANTCKEPASKAASVAANAAPALAALAGEPAVKGSGDAAGLVAKAISCLGDCDDGRAALVAAGAAARLVGLAGQAPVARSAASARRVAGAMGVLARSDPGAAALLVTGAAAAIVALADLFFSKKGGQLEREKSVDQVRSDLFKFGQSKVFIFEGWLQEFLPATDSGNNL